jgi:hypothetical protein
MTTSVQQHPYLAVLATHNDDLILADIVDEVVACV